MLLCDVVRSVDCGLWKFRTKLVTSLDWDYVTLTVADKEQRKRNREKSEK